MSITRLSTFAVLAALLPATAIADDVTVPERPGYCAAGDFIGVTLPGCSGPVEKPVFGPQGDDLPSNPTDG